jgi:hypothetical protein
LCHGLLLKELLNLSSQPILEAKLANMPISYRDTNIRTDAGLCPIFWWFLAICVACI